MKAARLNRAAGMLVLLAAGALLIGPPGVEALGGGGEECEGEYQILCAFVEECPDHGTQDDLCKEFCGQEWHAAECEEDTGHCAPYEVTLTCHDDSGNGGGNGGGGS